MSLELGLQTGSKTHTTPSLLSLLLVCGAGCELSDAAPASVTLWNCKPKYTLL